MSQLNNITPAVKPVNVTPHDTNYIVDEIPCKGILLGVAGDIAIKDVNGTTVVVSGLAAGVIHPISTNRILSTSTTATDICAFF